MTPTPPPPEPTDDEIRVRIAEACGWKWYRVPRLLRETQQYRSLFLPLIHEYPGQSEEWKVRADGTERIAGMSYMEKQGYLPNYLNSLDAMAEAEKTLTTKQRLKYIQALYKTTETDWSKDGCTKLPFASARQRCLAFLATINGETQ